MTLNILTLSRHNITEILAFQINLFVHMFIHIDKNFKFVKQAFESIHMRYILYYILTSSFALLSCGDSETEVQNGLADSVISYSVVPVPEWTALFNRTTAWPRGDGIFAIPFSGLIQIPLIALCFFLVILWSGKLEMVSLIQTIR
jgi:hypothetical protein